MEETQGTEVDFEEMNTYMGPAAIDGYMGFGNEMADVQTEPNEHIGVFDIPRELLLKLPIAEVTSDTRIIALNPSSNNGMLQPTPRTNNTIVPKPGTSAALDDLEPDVRPRNPPPTKAAPSGICEERQIEAMETNPILKGEMR